MWSPRTQNDRMKFTKPDGTRRPLGKRVVLSEARDISDFPEHLRSHPKVLALTQGNRIEDDEYGTIGAAAATRKPWGNAQLKEVDYALRLTETYVSGIERWNRRSASTAHSICWDSRATA